MTAGFEREPVAPYNVTIDFNANNSNPLSLSFTPGFDPNSGIAYGAVSLHTTTFVALSLAEGSVTFVPGQPK